MKICPKCQQQYPNGFQYCPNDTEFLITNEEYIRRTRPTPQRTGKEPPVQDRAEFVPIKNNPGETGARPRTPIVPPQPEGQRPKPPSVPPPPPVRPEARDRGDRPPVPPPPQRQQPPQPYREAPPQRPQQFNQQPPAVPPR